MSQPNVEAVRAVFERTARGDLTAFLEFADDLEFVTSPHAPDGGTYRGGEARKWLREWFGSFEAMTIEAEEIIAAGDKVFVGMVQRGRLSGSQSSIEGHWWQVSTFSEGRVVRAEVFEKRAEALEAAGLSE
jgi:ketosteroid isomerase-like protein